MITSPRGKKEWWFTQKPGGPTKKHALLFIFQKEGRLFVFGTPKGFSQARLSLVLSGNKG